MELKPVNVHSLLADEIEILLHLVPIFFCDVSHSSFGCFLVLVFIFQPCDILIGFKGGFFKIDRDYIFVISLSNVLGD